MWNLSSLLVWKHANGLWNFTKIWDTTFRLHIWPFANQVGKFIQFVAVAFVLAWKLLPLKKNNVKNSFKVKIWLVSISQPAFTRQSPREKRLIFSYPLHVMVKNCSSTIVDTKKDFSFVFHNELIRFSC